MKPTLEQIKTDESVWPEGATHYINNVYGFYYGESDSFNLPNHALKRNTTIKRPTKAFVPEVGEWCEYKISGKWYKGFYVGKSIEGRVVMEDNVFSPTKCDDIEEFRPIKSEREKFIDAYKEIEEEAASKQGRLVDALYDSGKFKLVEPSK